MKRKAAGNVSIAEITYPNEKLKNVEGSSSTFVDLKIAQSHGVHEFKRRSGVVIPYLFPRDDTRSSVRFTQVLSVYDHFEEDDQDDDPHMNHGIGIVGMKSESKQIENEVNEQAQFLLRRSCRCWYSKEELKKIKDECKSILSKIHFNTTSLDHTMHETRGLESYLSPDIRETNRKRRKSALHAVLYEQTKLKQLAATEQDDIERHIQQASLIASEGFRMRAIERAKQDAAEAAELYSPDEMQQLSLRKANSSVDERMDVEDIFSRPLNESISLMDIECFEGSDHDEDDSTLRYWAESSWTTTVLMEE